MEEKKVEKLTARSLKKYVGISRRKIARLAEEVKGKNIVIAKAKLSTLPQHAARELLKTIRSAEGNFLFKNQNYNTDQLSVSGIAVKQGPTLKRIRPRARGSANVIHRRSCHIEVVVAGS